jgi:hypothetical protein
MADTFLPVSGQRRPFFGLEGINENACPKGQAFSWSFYILSSGGVDELAGIGVKAEFCE